MPSRTDKNEQDGWRLQSERLLVAAAAAAERETPSRAQAGGRKPSRTAPDCRQGPGRRCDCAADQAAVGLEDRDASRHVSVDVTRLRGGDRGPVGIGHQAQGATGIAPLPTERCAWAHFTIPAERRAPPPSTDGGALAY